MDSCNNNFSTKYGLNVVIKTTETRSWWEANLEDVVTAFTEGKLTLR